MPGSANELEQVSAEPLCGGELFTLRWESDRMVRAWMPPGHDPSKEALPCLWLNDGQNVFRDEEVAFGGVSWGAADTVAHLMAAGSIPRLAVVAVDHAGARRPYDYLPEPPGAWGGMRREMGDAPGGGSAAYLERVLTELLPWAESRFGLSTQPKDRVFGGSSFGGISALYMAMLHPEAFSAVLVESPSFWACNGRLMRDVAEHEGKPWPARFYLAMGGCEYTATRKDSGEAGIACDRFLADACRQCGELLTAQGVSPSRLDWHVENGAAHNERDWRRRLPRALRWLLATDGVIAPEPAPAFWTWPSPVRPGRPFELYADPCRLQLPAGGTLQVHLGFDAWSRALERVPLLPAGLPRERTDGVEWLAALICAPEGARDLRFAITDGTMWDNNGGKDYELPVAEP